MTPVKCHSQPTQCAYIGLWRGGRCAPLRTLCCRSRLSAAPGGGSARRRVRPYPLAGVGSVHQPPGRTVAFQHGYIRTGATPPTAGGGWYTRRYTWCTTPHVAVPRQRQKRGGRSRLVPLRWRGSGTTGQDEKPEQRQRRNDEWRVTPPTLLLVHSPLCLCTILLDPRRDPHRDPGTVQTTGQRHVRHTAPSGRINRVVLHVV